MRILIVEDEAIIALCIGMTLREAGHDVMGPVSSLSACAKLAGDTMPDLALVDINLESGGSGVDVARMLMERWGVMSIFVSAQEVVARRARDAAVAHLNKPFDTKTLLASVDIAETLLQGVMPTRVPFGLELFVQPGDLRPLH
ncbi:regulator [Skermanella stibiiresistens SB22]|uniref:Regulator n=1 Tax=Skermanella stibiiresistens SB22 TaxID=1385369 RepID=W9HFK0_9PROT|nr:response regulator [Skermanella stibiiresistens]EWY42648.1 regulator [Skermanella stibiiresistens SB22]